MSNPYDIEFYKRQTGGSSRSAAEVVPIVLRSFPNTRSVVDIGCGTGGWVRQFTESGLSDCLEVDGGYVTADMLKIPPGMFKNVDLVKPFDLGRRFDLACSLEVAEHLPKSSASGFVESLVKAAPVILFSAAIPGQGGTEHINEQWPSYWAEMFGVHRYRPFDFIRPHIFRNPDVEWWYQQNILIFCSPESAPSTETVVESEFLLDRVHPDLLAKFINWPHTSRDALSAIKRSAGVLARRAASRTRD